MKSRWIKQPSWLSVCAIILIVAGVVLGSRFVSWFQAVELVAYDWTLRYRVSKNFIPPSPIVLITITDQDIQRLGHWPISDKILAEVLNQLLQYKTAVIGLDIYRDLPVLSGQDELNAVFERHREIITVMKFGATSQGGIPGPSVLADTDQVGFSDMVVDPDGVVRRGLLFLDDEGLFASSFGFLVAMRFLDLEGVRPQPHAENPEVLQLGTVPFYPFEKTDGGYQEVNASGYQFLLNVDVSQTFPQITLQELRSGAVAKESLHNKIVLIGSTAESIKDFFPTAWCGWWTSCQYIAGVELQAAIVQQLIQAAQHGLTPMQTISDGEEQVWIVMWIVLGGLLGLGIRMPWRLIGATGFGVVLIGGLALVAAGYGLWIPLVPPAVGWVLVVGLVTISLSHQEKLERQLLMDLFGRHVAPEVVERLWMEREDMIAGGRLRPRKQMVTTVFADLEGFTGISEVMEPTELLNWLNSYMDRMVVIILDHRGIVDDYHGDMIKADFGSLESRVTEQDVQKDALLAIACAWKMQCAMQELHQEWAQSGMPKVRLRIGVQTGPVVMGCLGSAQRQKYTTIGDTVNIAARLESFEKDSSGLWPAQGVCRILLGGTTQHYIHHEWQTQNVGTFYLRGKEKEIMVYRLVGKIGNESSAP